MNIPDMNIPGMNIAVDGFTLDLREGTGLSQYASLLQQSLGKLASQVEVIYGARLSRARGIPPEIAIANVAPSASTSRLERLLSRIALPPAPRSPRWPLSVERVALRGSLATGTPAPIATSTSALVANSLWDISRRHLMTYGRLYPIALPPDVTAVHWTMPLPVYAVNTRNIYTILDLIPLTMPWATADHVGYHWSLIRRILDTASLITVPTHATLADIRRLFPHRDVPAHVVELGVAPPEERYLDEHDLARSLKGLFDLGPKDYFLSVGTLQPRKNLPRLIDSYLMCDLSVPLVVAGSSGWYSGSTRAMLDRLDRLDRKKTRAHGQVQYLGYVTDAELDLLIRGARALLFPSLAEGFGLPIVEAFLRGTAVLTSAGGATEEVAGDAAMLVDPYSVDSIREGISTLASDDRYLGSLVERGTARAKIFTADAFTERLGSAYARAGIA